MRFILGVALVVVWKSILKPVLFTILPPHLQTSGRMLCHGVTLSRRRGPKDIKTDP